MTPIHHSLLPFFKEGHVVRRPVQSNFKKVGVLFPLRDLLAPHPQSSLNIDTTSQKRSRFGIVEHSPFPPFRDLFSLNRPAAVLEIIVSRIFPLHCPLECFFLFQAPPFATCCSCSSLRTGRDASPLQALFPPPQGPDRVPAAFFSFAA